MNGMAPTTYLDWDLCRIFTAVAEAGSYSGAGRSLRMSHSTVGRRLAELERLLGCKLLARQGEQLVLTSQGERFHLHTVDMAAKALQGLAAVAVAARDARGFVKLSIGATLLSHWLMPRLAEFLSAHPHIEVETVTQPFPANLHRGEADVGLRPVDKGDENLACRKVARLRTAFYASKAYVERHGLPERRADWNEHRVIGVTNRVGDMGLGRWIAAISSSARVVLRCSSQSDMLAAVKTGIGITPLLCFVGDGHDDLVRVAPTKLCGTTDLWLVAHPDLINLPATRAVADFVAASAKADRLLLLGVSS
jgi:DNA-binding transcriptional LysR family regulator